MNSIILPASIYRRVRACLFSSSLASKQAGWQEGSLCARSQRLGAFVPQRNEQSEPSCRSSSLFVSVGGGWAAHRVQRVSLVRSSARKKMIAKPNATAPVWEYSGFKPNEQPEPTDTDEPVGRICSKVVKIICGDNKAPHSNFL